MNKQIFFATFGQILQGVNFNWLLGVSLIGISTVSQNILKGEMLSFNGMLDYRTYQLIQQGFAAFPCVFLHHRNEALHSKETGIRKASPLP
jgi:hypothetical protein